MPATFICRMSDQNNGILKIHLTLDLGQRCDAFFNVTHEVLALLCNTPIGEGDEVEVQLRRVRQRGSNGHPQR